MAIKDGKADIIAMGREMIADPEIANKASSGKVDDIRPCIACFYCQDTGSIKNSPLTCAENGSVGKERECEIKPARSSKRIAIIGGGPAGMEAARVLSLRGHKVVVFEKENLLGGQLRLAMVPPHKKDRVEPLIAYLQGQLAKLNVEIRLNTEANVKAISALKPDAVILASGAKPLVPRIAGVDLGRVVTAFDILAGRAEAGGKVLIVGGGSIGCETAEFLFEKGKGVTVVEMLPQLAMDMGFRDRVRMLNRISSMTINFITGATCSEIRPEETIVVSEENKKRSIQSDTVILAVGSKPNNSLYLSLRAAGFEPHLAGDCWRIGKIADAIGDGLRLGFAL